MENFYLDNGATTKVFEEAIEKARSFLNVDFYNPSAVYDKSISVKKKINEARDYILDGLGASGGNLFFTASATEANNMVIFSNKNFNGKRFLFGAGEHPSVYECAKELKNRGANVEFIPLDKSGRVDEKAYLKMLDKDVCFISIQHVSNETGAINDIKYLCEAAKNINKNVLFHSDGVQAFMKQEFSVDDLGVDYYTISAHKIGGPKGIGALYVKKGAKIAPLIFGGGQESGLRSGTENVFNIIAFYEAVKIMKTDFDKNMEKLKTMHEELLESLSGQNINYEINGSHTISNIISLSMDKSVRGETLLHALERRGVYISTGSACSAGKNYNRTLEAMGLDKERILSSVRISLFPYINFDAKKIAKIIKEELTKLKEKNYG